MKMMMSLLIVLIVCPVGCSAPNREFSGPDATAEALAERDAALQRFAKAVANLCAAQHRLQEERVKCVVEKRLQAQRQLRAAQEHKQPFLAAQEHDRRTRMGRTDLALLNCERRNAETLCQRKRPDVNLPRPTEAQSDVLSPGDAQK